MTWGLPVHGGYLTSGYGPRTSPGGVGSTWHRGIDVGGRGTDWLVRAVGRGHVLASGRNPVRGLWVAVRHDDGTTSAYQHLADVRVMVGQAVTAGTPLGRMGMTGTSTALHLHLEVIPAGRWLRSGTAWASTGRTVDPEPWLRARGVDARRGVTTVTNPGVSRPGSSLPDVPTLTPIAPLLPEEDDDMALIIDAGEAGSYLLSGGRLLGLDADARARLAADGADVLSITRERYLQWIAGTGPGVLLASPGGAYVVSVSGSSPTWVPDMAQVDDFRARGFAVVPVSQTVYDALVSGDAR